MTYSRELANRLLKELQERHARNIVVSFTINDAIRWLHVNYVSDPSWGTMKRAIDLLITRKEVAEINYKRNAYGPRRYEYAAFAARTASDGSDANETEA